MTSRGWLGVWVLCIVSACGAMSACGGRSVLKAGRERDSSVIDGMTGRDVIGTRDGGWPVDYAGRFMDTGALFGDSGGWLWDSGGWFADTGAWVGDTGGWPRDTGISVDGCVRPQGWCASARDCQAGYACQGCYPDPCNPMLSRCFGVCAPEGSCRNNQECAVGSYCSFAQGCGSGGTSGTCAKMPNACTKENRPVCGCDHQTYSNSCMAARAGTSVAREGACLARSCDDVAAAYRTALARAKQCCADCDVIQCRTLLTNVIACLCPTYIEDHNGDAVAQLEALALEWSTFQCDRQWACPLGVCLQPAGASCEPSGTGEGTCSDRPSR